MHYILTDYLPALFTAIAYGLGVLIGMSIISYILVTIGGAQKAPSYHHDDGHAHEPAPKATPAPEPSPAPVAETAPAAEEPKTEAPAEEKPEA